MTSRHRRSSRMARFSVDGMNRLTKVYGTMWTSGWETVVNFFTMIATVFYTGVWRLVS